MSKKMTKKGTPAPSSDPQTPPRKIGAGVVAEVILAALCVIAWVLFFVRRTCGWDVLLLIIWAVILPVAAILLVRGERRLAAARRTEKEGHSRWT